MMLNKTIYLLSVTWCFFKCSNVHGLVLLKWLLSNVSSTESICVEMMLCLEHWNFAVIYRCNRLWCTLYSNLKIIWLCIANMIMLQRLLIISLEVFCCAGWEFLALTSWLRVIIGNFLSGCVCVCVWLLELLTSVDHSELVKLCLVMQKMVWQLFSEQF